MAPYIISYLHAFGEKSNVTANDAIWVQSLIFAGQGLFMCVGGMVDNYLGPRVTSYLGSILASTGVAISYFSINVSMGLMALTYGFVFGSGVGLAYISPLSAGMKWFPNNKGLVNGIIVGGYGLGAFVFTQVQTRYLNPHNSKINENGYFTDTFVLNHVPNVFLLLGAIYASLQLVGASMLSLPNEVIKEKEKIIDLNNETSIDASYGSVEKILKCDFEESNIKDDIVLYQSFTPKQMLCYRQFYILWFTFFFNIQIVNYVVSMYKSFGQTFIKDDQFLATVGAAAAVFNAVGRIIWGLLIDKFNYKVINNYLVCMLALTAGLCLFMATL
uniref:Major facilitator superfamily (MFS) profile domain-containing protein n=1 Tax=Strigamia maritima TaxID=126957 RepID=T1IZR5_STRMM